MCSMKCASQLLVCKIIKCFLVDENGSVDSLKVCCLIPKVGSVTLLDDTPSHLLDICLFNLANVIYSPLEVVPVRAQKFSIPEYQEVVKHFSCVKKNCVFRFGQGPQTFHLIWYLYIEFLKLKYIDSNEVLMKLLVFVWIF